MWVLVSTQVHSCDKGLLELFYTSRASLILREIKNQCGEICHSCWLETGQYYRHIYSQQGCNYVLRFITDSSRNV
jgi:hypothetical protein